VPPLHLAYARSDVHSLRKGVAQKWDDIPEHVQQNIIEGFYHGGALGKNDYDEGHADMTLVKLEHIHTYTHAYIHAHTHTHIHTYMHTYMQTHRHTYLCTANIQKNCMQCMQAHTHIHTYTHEKRQSASPLI